MDDIPAGTAAAIAANRFGLGARPGELAGVAGDPRGALRAQLAGGPPLLAGQGLVDGATALGQAESLRQALRAAKRGEQADVAAAFMKVGEYYRPLYVAEARARLQSAADCERPFVERLVHFWSNHFAVSVDKALVLGLAGPYEREAIRPHVLGRFADLLHASAQHPAMLLYLDNAQSVGPTSRAARFVHRARARPAQSGIAGGGATIGLNENLAREILELHTLGVDGGYTQADVTEFARVLTGWSIGGGQGRLRGGEPGRYFFREALHEPGARELLGRRYREGGESQGLAVLDDLARSPATARHLATQLARHFAGDEPPPALIERLAHAWLEHDGDLLPVYRALVDSPECWAQPLVKYKTPFEYVASAYRALAVPLPVGQRALTPLELLGQRTWSPGSPAGWADRAADWDGPSALLKRLEWADQVGQRLGAQRDAAALAREVLGGVLTAHTHEAIAHADSGAQALTLLLGSPEFLRR